VTRGNGDLKLWADTTKVPDGFLYHENFITAAEEQELTVQIEQLPLEPFQYYQFTGKRRTASFGWQYQFGTNQIATAPDIPSFLVPVRDRVGSLFSIDPGALAQVSIIEYSVGSPIGWHRDVPYFGVVAGISLGAACRMRFRRRQGSRSKKFDRKDVLSIDLAPRSVYLMSGASRDLWQHSIPPVKDLRYSIMMRTVRPLA
jgi:alkylated DNA repair dioxygenase AlkB